MDFKEYEEKQSKIIENIFLLANEYKYNLACFNSQNEELTGNELKENNRVRINDVKVLLKNYENLSYTEEEFKAIINVINEGKLTLKEVDQKLKDICNYKKNKPIDELKPFTIKCLYRYIEEKQGIKRVSD